MVVRIVWDDEVVGSNPTTPTNLNEGYYIMQYLQEVTKWDTAALGHKVPNHTYMLDNRQWCVGYIKEGTTEEIIFSKPLKQFSKSYRKFKTLASGTGT